jgi:hypothetical protein
MVLTLVFLWSAAVHSQNPYRLSAGARQVGLAYASSSTTGFWTSFHNQASLAHMRKLSIGINQDNRFGLAELSNKTFGFILPSGHGSLGAVYSYYGYTDYSLHTVGLAYGMKLGSILSVGVQADLFSAKGEIDYEYTNELSFQIGALIKPAKGLSIGLHVFNPLPNIERQLEIPSVITLGVGYLFSGTFYTGVDLESSNSGHNNLRLGMEYQAYENFFIRGGLMSNPRGGTFGFGYSGRIFQGNIGFITHENLGLTPSLSLVIYIR